MAAKDKTKGQAERLQAERLRNRLIDRRREILGEMDAIDRALTAIDANDAGALIFALVILGELAE
jgi:hypothetical protein